MPQFHYIERAILQKAIKAIEIGLEYAELEAFAAPPDVDFIKPDIEKMRAVLEELKSLSAK